MVTLRKCSINGKILLIYHSIIITLLILIWICDPYNHEEKRQYLITPSISGSSLETKYKQRRTLNVRFNRLLSKHRPHRELMYAALKENISDNTINKLRQNEEYVLSAYEQTRIKGLNNLNAYNRRYKRRYSIKNGLAKIDCYCERKVFDALDNIQRLADNRQKNKKGLKRWFFKKYGVPMILFTLIPLLGAIIHTVLELKYIQNKLFPYYDHEPNRVKVQNVNHKYTGYCYTKDISVNTWISLEIINKICLYASILIIAFVIIYICIKVIKYERLKAGKGKIKGKDYYRFCKSLFI